MTDKIDTSPEALRAYCNLSDVPSNRLESWVRQACVVFYTLADEKAAWTAREADLEHHLRNILAVIFRDGGQRAATYPTLAEAVEAAHLEWAELVRERDNWQQAAQHWMDRVVPVKARAEQAEADAAAMQAELSAAADALYNGFEPDNQSRAWHRARRAATERGRDLLARMERMRKALALAAKRFRFYEKQHRAKDTQDGRIKAENNSEYAEMCERALADQPGEKA